MSIALAATAPRAGREEDFKFRAQQGLPALRRDLQITQVSYRRRKNWVVKDPSSLRYFRWGEWDYRVAGLLDGRRQLEDVAAELSKWLGKEADQEQVQATVDALLSVGLLRTGGTIARRLHEKRREMAARKKKQTRLLALASKIISFKVTLFDPDLLLLRMSRRLRFLWTPGAALILMLMLGGSAWLILANQSSLGDRMPDLLGWQNLLIMWLVMVAVKVVHEFGHGLACKHFGGEVHEMGAMFILFSPFLFCNASDSWTFREKRKRLVVNFAGIYLELFLAAAAAALWVLTQPGLFNQICFNVMLVCSVITIFFNANPLMKFDGYYALSDWMEIPNLKERGDRALVSTATGFLTGESGAPDDPVTSPIRGRLMLYAMASYAWTFIVAYNILTLLGGVLEPYGLDRLAQVGASLALLTGVLAPPIMVALHVRKVLANSTEAAPRREIIKRVVVVSLVLASLLAMPWPVTVRGACAIEARGAARITAATQGYLREIKCADGQRVEAGAVLAELQNPELARLVRDLELRLTSLRAAIASAENDPEYRRDISGLRAQAKQLETALAQARLDRDGLALRSPVAGVVSGRGLQEKTGVLLRRGDLFCRVLPEGSSEAVLVAGEAEAGKVRVGQRVFFRLNSLTSRTFSGEVTGVTEQPVVSLPHQSLGQHAGGTVPSVLTAHPAGAVDANSPVAVPTGQVFAITVAIDDNEGLLRPGMSGRIKIDCGRRSLGATLWEKFTSMLRTDFRL